MPKRRLVNSALSALLVFFLSGMLHAQSVTAKTTQGFPSTGKMGRSRDFVLAELTTSAALDGLQLDPATVVSITAKVQPDGSVRLLLDTAWLSGALTALVSDPGVVLDNNGAPVSQQELNSRVHHGFFTMPKNTVITFAHVRLAPEKK